MSLETKLAKNLMALQAKAKAKKAGASQSKGGDSQKATKYHRVEIEKLDKGVQVTAHKKPSDGNGRYDYSAPMKTAHKNVKEAMAHAKSCLGSDDE